MSVINLENVSFIYPRAKNNALEKINLSINEGEFLAVMGENGAGKTTFCKLINGIIPHLSGGRLSGTVTVNGIETKSSSVPQLALLVGMTLDDPDAQLFTSSVRYEAAFGLQNILMQPDDIEKNVKFALNAVGLAGFEDRAPVTLSGGEKQRLSIATALAMVNAKASTMVKAAANAISDMKGKILVLDEPLCQLDPQGAWEVMSVLRELRKNEKITIIMTTHDSEKAFEYADRVCILKNGKIAALDTAKNIFADTGLLEENGIQPLTDPPYAPWLNSFLSNAPCPLLLNSNQSSVSTPVIEIKNFSYTYPGGAGIKSETLLRNINLSIGENDFLAIIGNNGCGKTTLLKSITGLLRPCEGDIYIRGKNTKELSVSDISREIGFVMQNPDSQLFTDSVYNEAAFALKNMRLPKTEIKQRVEDALKTVGLDDPNAFPPALSQADRTKTLIACVLAMGCKIIIFDEVDAGSDYSGSLKIMNIARGLNSKGFTIIFITHNMFLAGEFARRIIKMERDGIVFDGRRED
jgi:energy-coupling factor transport system ATP-binding protein